MLTISDRAKEKILEVLRSQEPPADAVRVAAAAAGRYSMNLEPDGKPSPEDTIYEYEGFRVFVDPQSVPFVESASLDYLETFGGGGFKFSGPQAQVPQKKQPPEGPEGEVWRQIQQILDEEINPAVAAHGGYIDLLDVKDRTVYVQMGGGCQGCGMANVTLKQGVEALLKDRLPDIEEILDVTDHAAGRNPYYAPATK